jgi:hypothetical protein
MELRLLHQVDSNKNFNIVLPLSVARCHLSSWFADFADEDLMGYEGGATPIDISLPNDLPMENVISYLKLLGKTDIERDDYLKYEKITTYVIFLKCAIFFDSPALIDYMVNRIRLALETANTLPLLRFVLGFKAVPDGELDYILEEGEGIAEWQQQQQM